MSVQPVPEGFHTATPYLIIKGAAEAIEFYKKAFDATEVMRLDTPEGTVGHAEIQIGNSRIMLADEAPEMGCVAPQSSDQAGITMHLYVQNVDDVFDQAIAAGGEVQRPVQDQFYGDRSGTLADPFHHVWTVSTHIEDVSRDEVKKRMAEMINQ